MNYFKNKKLKTMNTININGMVYILPTEPQYLKSCLNHIDMTRKGLKKFVKLIDLEGKEHLINSFELEGAKIEKNIN